MPNVCTISGCSDKELEPHPGIRKIILFIEIEEPAIDVGTCVVSLFGCLVKVIGRTEIVAIVLVLLANLYKCFSIPIPGLFENGR
jgi:hypothetical protein